jgi:hypothetical protein
MDKLRPFAWSPTENRYYSLSNELSRGFSEGKKLTR